MKKQLLTVLLFSFIVNCIYSQTTFTNSIVPAIGDIHNYKIAKSSSLNNLISAAGANAVWNCAYADSMSNNVAQSLSINWEDPAGKPNEATVTGESLASSEGTANKYSFYNSDANSWYFLGEAFYALGNYQYTAYNSNLDLIRFPFNYTNTFSDTVTGNWVFSGNNMQRTNISKTTYDSYGTISFNNMGAYNVHRILTEQNIKDTSLQVGGVAIAVYTKRKIYSFYDGSNDQPLVQILLDSSRTVGFINTTLNTSRILVHQTVLGLKNINEQGFSVTPNPASDYINIILSDSKQDAVFYITDISGRIIDTKKLKQNSNIFNYNTSVLSPGTYIIKIESNGQINQQKLVKM